MGFKDIQTFNSALLAKQIGRILTKPNQLVSKVLMAKYCKKDFVIETDVLKNASWYWQSIMSARYVLKGGSTRSVRDGKSIDILIDSWIPEYDDDKIKKVKPHNCELSTVDQLIHQGQWNTQILHEIFSKEEAEVVGRIPISATQKDDNLSGNTTGLGNTHQPWL
ncbi:hypothetical protein ACH5RR_023208 [Cinchona calisaya]|uniref:Uncharacterized protein n=1 Tax=Cinchona calisaya TaxID=153742 RepID=A0ABD2ZA03_9GENT